MITSEMPQVSLDGRYNVTQTCKALGIHRKTLKRYAEEGKIRARYRRVNNRAFFLGADILALWRSVW